MHDRGGVFLAQQMFISIDPISSMHLGIIGNPEDAQRAEYMSRYILKKVPNNLLQGCEVANLDHHKCRTTLLHHEGPGVISSSFSEENHRPKSSDKITGDINRKLHERAQNIRKSYDHHHSDDD